MDPQYARAVLEELGRRNDLASRMLADCLPQQRAAILDPARLKALFCTRRAGKSFTLGVYLFLGALQNPGCSCLYLGLTKGSALGIMDKDILRQINRRYALGAEWRESKQRWELPNGSYIYLRGADANSYEISKVVGQKYRLAVLDEASKYRYVVADMVYRDLLPAMGDDYGTIILSGTPSNITAGLFFEATTGKAPGWSTHSWKWWENTYARTNIQRLHDETLAKHPAYRDTPAYRQEWLGEWVIDTSVLVYRYRDDLNTAAELPPGQYVYMLGVDLGFTDPTALVVGAYQPHDPVLYLVYAQARAGLTISDVAEWIRGLQARYPFAAMVADAAALQGVEEMRQRHNLPLESAEKPGKRGVIEVLNSDLQTGRLKVLPEAMAITEEWAKLVWDERKLEASPPRWEEHPSFPNHLADACLYMWRKARNYTAQPAPAPAPQPWTQQYHEEVHLQRELDEINRRKRNGGVYLDELPAWMDEQYG